MKRWRLTIVCAAVTLATVIAGLLLLSYLRSKQAASPNPTAASPTAASENSSSEPESAESLQSQWDDEFAAGEAQFIAEHPLVKYLDPNEESPPNATFTYSAARDIYTFTLAPAINQPLSDAEYNQVIEDTKTDVLNWVKSKGVDPAKIKIEWALQ